MGWTNRTLPPTFFSAISVRLIQVCLINDFQIDAELRSHHDSAFPKHSLAELPRMEAKVQKMQGMFTKDLEELQNRQAEMN